MPRCQRTFRRLGPGDTQPGSGAARWVCPFCTEAEVYETVRDFDLLSYASLAEDTCRRDFGSPSDAGRPTLLLFGLNPECVMEPTDRQYNLYLQKNSDPFQLRLQIGHEMFHRVCSQGRVFHWTHEMLACLVSIRLLRRSGADEYALQMEQEYEAEAEKLPLRAMLEADLGIPPYPAGLYGRAYVTGRALAEEIGWSGLSRLARSLNGRGVPDIGSWLRALPEEAATTARGILGITGKSN